jgi:hypothetical protein
MSSGLRIAASAALSLVFLAGCASSQQKMRREQREKAVQNTRLYCEFLNGEQYPDIDVALNLQMAAKCDADKSITITDYKTPSEIPGVMFCCSVHPRALPGGAKAEAAAPKEHLRHQDPVVAPTPAPHREAMKPVAAPTPLPTPPAAVEAAKNYPSPEVQGETATKTEVKTENKAEVKSETKTDVKTETKSSDDLDE